MALQRSFTGLADLLGFYEGGSLPAEFEGVVTPTLDALHFLRPPDVEGGVFAANALAAFQSTPVPDNECWFLHHFGWITQSVVGAGITSFHCTGLVVPPDPSQAFEVMPALQTTPLPTAGQVAGAGQGFPTPGLFVGPGYNLRIYVKSFAGAGSTNVNYGWQVTKMRI